MQKTDNRPNATVVCTVVSKNYIAAARTLMESIRALHDDIQLAVLLVDRIDDSIDPSLEDFDVLLAEDISIPKWKHFALKYDILELNTATKPYLLEALFDKYDAQNVIYIDPDIVVYNRLDVILDLLQSYGVILTPHLLDPLEDDKLPSELNILQAGTYNLGFIALSRTNQWRELLQWWQRRLYNQCTREVEKGLFVDQKWADLIPGLFDGVYILRDPGYNVGYWNYKTRELVSASTGHFIGDLSHPLVFAHFSGFSVDDMEIVSKHQNRFTLSTLGAAYSDLFFEYRDRLIRNGYADTHGLRYHYGEFEDGVPIPDAMRICLRQHDIDGKRWPDPFTVTETSNFRSWALTPDKGKYLSPYLRTIHATTHGMRDAFPLRTLDDELAFANWFLQSDWSGPTFHEYYRNSVLAAVGKADSTVEYTPSNPPVTSRPRLAYKGRLARTVRYYRRFPKNVKPFLPSDLLDRPTGTYTGPAGFYGGIRQQLYKFGILDQARRAIGLRTILTARYFFANPRGNEENWASPHGHTSGRITRAEGAEDIPDGVNVVGYIHSETGVGQAGRSLLSALKAVNYPAAVLPIKVQDLARQYDHSSGEFQRGTPYALNVFVVNADMTNVVRGLLPEDVYKNRYNIGYWAWELDDFPDDWVNCFEVYDEIWVHSTFAQESISKKSPIPVVRIPVSFEIGAVEAMSRDDLGIPADRFIVLFVFDARSVIERKNPWAVVRAFSTAFSESERESDVKLVMKVSNLGDFPDDAKRLRAEVKNVGGIILEDYLSRQQTYALLNTADAYISLHRSEGFGLTMAEAMALGRPVIGTAYSGNEDFMKPEISFPVPYKLVSLTKDYHPYRQGNVWAEPDIDAAAAALRSIYDDPESAADKGRASASYMAEHHSPRAVGEEIAKRIGYITESLRQDDESNRSHESSS